MSYRAKDYYRDAGVAKVYDQERFASLKGRIVDRREQGLIAAALRHAGARPGWSVLDIPCGTGRVSRTLAESGLRLTGVDVSDAMLERAAARLADLPADERPALQAGDAEALPFADATFDAVVSLRLLGHLPPETRLRVLREFRRVSRGAVVLAFYHRAALQSRLRRARRRGTSWYAVSLDQIDAELREAGLIVVRRAFLLPGISETVVVLARSAT